MELYNKLIPHKRGEIKEEDLYTTDAAGNKVYNRENKYNISSQDGCIAHLIQGANTLRAEIDIVAQATVIREKDGKIINNKNELIACSQYGQRERNSDPLVSSSSHA